MIGNSIAMYKKHDKGTCAQMDSRRLTVFAQFTLDIRRLRGEQIQQYYAANPAEVICWQMLQLKGRR